MIDWVFILCCIELFVDFGVVWGVEGVYIFCVLDKYLVKEVVLVDGCIILIVVVCVNLYL